MKIFKLLSPIILATLLALVYVHQQVELVKLSYTIETRDKMLKDMLDHKGSLDYNISNLEDPSRLENVLSSKNIDVSFPNRFHVVKAARPAPKSISVERLRSSVLETKFLSGITEFLSPRAEAQAKEK